MSGYILALDQGTTSSRAILYNDQAHPIKIAQQPTSLQTPKAIMSNKMRSKYGKRRSAELMTSSTKQDC